jgi:hypothetical protein
MTRRLNAEERRGFAAYARGINQYTAYVTGQRVNTPAEPALGTLDERLAIIIRRHGGRLSVPKPTAEELASVESWTVEDQDRLL